MLTCCNGVVSQLRFGLALSFSKTTQLKNQAHNIQRFTPSIKFLFFIAAPSFNAYPSRGKAREELEIPLWVATRIVVRPSFHLSPHSPPTPIKPES